MKKVYRSRHSKVLGGVAAGLADYFGMDVTVMRLLFAFLLVTMPNAIIAYILAWIIIPEEPAGVRKIAPARVDTGGAAMTQETPQIPNSGMTADEILRKEKEPFVPDVPGAPQAEAQAPATTTGQGQQPATPVTPSPAASTPNEVTSSNNRSRQLLGYILIAVGGAVVMRRYIPSHMEAARAARSGKRRYSSSSPASPSS